VYLGNDPGITKYIELCIAVSETIFFMLEIGLIRTSAELFNASNKLFKKYCLQGSSYSSTADIWNLGHTLYLMEQKATYSQERHFVSNEDDWDLRCGDMFTFEPQYLSLKNPSYPKLMHHYLLQYVNGKFQICKKCVDDSVVQRGVVKKEVI